MKTMLKSLAVLLLLTTGVAAFLQPAFAQNNGIALQNNVELDNLSARRGGEVRFTFDVPENAARLEIRTSGGQGNADLYVRHDTQPTLRTFDCRSIDRGTAESCSANNPDAGTYHIMVNARRNFRGVSLSARYIVPDAELPPDNGPPDQGISPVVLQRGVPLTGLSGTEGLIRYFVLRIPESVKDISFALSGGSGNADLFVRKDIIPIVNRFDCSSEGEGNNESCTQESGTAGNYFIMIRGAADYSDVSLVANYNDGTEQPIVEPPQGDEKPNFLLIISDDQGVDASSQYAFSDDLPTTPNIDQLAGEGIVFDNAWATPSCTTTRGTLLTGLHGVNSGVETTPALLDTDLLTVQKLLGESGEYQNGVFGKWHLAGGGNNADPLHPNESGADYYAGNIAGTISDYYNWQETINGVTTTSTTYHTTEVTNQAIDWISEQEGPWFSWVAYVAPHSPFHVPPADLHTQTLIGTEEDIAENPRPYFLAAIEAMDTEIGRLIDSLDPEDRDNTIIIFMGDNGTTRAVLDTRVFPASHGKTSLYEGGVRVPFVVSGAMVNGGNARESGLINTVDLLPTLSEAAGIAAPSEIDGVSFLPLLTGDASANDEARQFNYTEFMGTNTNGYTVRDAQYKLIEFADGTRELYDVANDLREQTNLVAQPELAERIAQLDAFADEVRGGETGGPGGGGGGGPGRGNSIDITGVILENTSANCADYAANYNSLALDVNNNLEFAGDLQIEVAGGTCAFNTNAIPNHDFNDGARSFPNDVSEQDDQYIITANPVMQQDSTPLLLTMDNAVLLNGVKVDILAAACFEVGDERTGCTDPEQPWRFDPLFAANGFNVDSHNAHSQPNGGYHYHGKPNALFEDSGANESPVVGFAADGFPIYGSYFNDGSEVRAARSSYQLKTGRRPNSEGNPGGIPDGTYRDDYEFVEGVGDLDECNGMVVNGTYGYYMTDEFPYILSCFRGTPNESFFK